MKKPRVVVSVEEMAAIIRKEEDHIRERLPEAKYQEVQDLIQKMNKLRSSLDSALLKPFPASDRKIYREKAKKKLCWVRDILEEEGVIGEL